MRYGDCFTVDCGEAFMIVAGQLVTGQLGGNLVATWWQINEPKICFCGFGRNLVPAVVPGS